MPNPPVKNNSTVRTRRFRIKRSIFKKHAASHGVVPIETWLARSLISRMDKLAAHDQVNVNDLMNKAVYDYLAAQDPAVQRLLRIDLSGVQREQPFSAMQREALKELQGGRY